MRLGVFSLAFYTTLFHLSVVRGSSMAPGIRDGDRILVEPWSYLLDSAHRGDVVLDGFHRQVELARDELVGQPLQQQ